MNNCDITLYGILDPNRSNGRDLSDLASAAIRGGITVLQYRDKNADIRHLIEQGRAIKQAIAGSSVPLLINDHIDVAQAIGADGVHLGQEDMSPFDARQILGQNAVIGLTIKTEEHARAAPTKLLDYVCVGGVFDSLSKDNPTSIGIDGWQAVAAHFRRDIPQLPVGAIAGIDGINVADVIRAGADGVAIISALFMAENIEQACREMRANINSARKSA